MVSTNDAWRTQLRHPRGTRWGGRWAEAISSKIEFDRGLAHKRVPGRDLTDWVKTHTRRLAQLENKIDYNALGADWQRDHVLAEIAKEQGWDALPETVSGAELDRLIDERGAVEIFRGVSGEYNERPVWEWGDRVGQPAEGWRAERTPLEMHRRLREGPMVQYGLGIWGNGLYFSVRRRVAEAFGNQIRTSDGFGADPDSVQRAALRPDARVIDYMELLDRWPGSQGKNALGVPQRPIIPKSAGEPEWADVESHGAQGPKLPGVIGRDMGRYAAMLGYDAIRVVNASDGFGRQSTGRYADQYVVLNRTALVFEEMRGATDDAGA